RTLRRIRRRSHDLRTSSVATTLSDGRAAAVRTGLGEKRIIGAGTRIPPCTRHLPVCVGAAGSRTVIEPSVNPWSERQGSVVCLSDAFGDRQTKADPCVIGANAVGAASERLAKRGDDPWAK